jgi:THO complex subunit 7
MAVSSNTQDSALTAAAQGQSIVVPLTVEEEGTFTSMDTSKIILKAVLPDQIILARITNDERPLRRVLKKFHSYTAMAHLPVVPPLLSGAGDSLIEDVREAFLVELASFQLSLKKSAMICEAEARQVEEYQRERQRIGEQYYLVGPDAKD